jgi:internalin A
MRKIAHLGGRFSLDTEFVDPPTYGPPQWLKQLLGERLFANIVSINLGTTQIDDGSLEQLLTLNHLQSLGIWQTQIGDAGLAAVVRLAELDTLDISQTEVSDDGLRQLAERLRVRVLVVGGRRLTDRGLVHLKQMANLELLCVVGDQFSGPAKDDLQQSLPDTTVVFMPLPKVAGGGNRGRIGNPAKPPI